ncbi:thioredoxin-dependent peroxidase [Dacryopinax primogenitus]|uniref:Putative peroxiredoxin n=1 Tax=Dacryopinax primogenitus (strain DJM 731) TaxID=1858805 RepID=M5FRH0_DACPD|nr:thioredoxin-dependent peroxidase [Dacryopinax primogenitus]EJT99725.1 thioredoxin-dependent peroxidase [Dacryopinax primogenitus]
MATIKVGDTVPEGTFNYIPWTPELENGLVCGVPNKIHTDAWKGKTVVIVAVPGAFTPTCHANHLPPFVQRVSELKSKGASVVACLASNDQFVMSGWGRSQGIKDEILMLSDTYCAWTDQLGLSQDLTERGMGKRTKRFALILDDLKVKYIGVDSKPGVVESSVDAVLAHL